MTIIIALERVAAYGWQRIWIESDSMGALSAFANPSIVPWDLRNHWSNATSLGLTLCILISYGKAICARTN
jgi:hypothetical protein